MEMARFGGPFSELEGATTMPAPAIDPPQERLAIAQTRGRCVRIEVWLLDASLLRFTAHHVAPIRRKHSSGGGFVIASIASRGAVAPLVLSIPHQAQIEPSRTKMETLEQHVKDRVSTVLNGRRALMLNSLDAILGRPRSLA